MPERDCATCTLAHKEEWGCWARKIVTEDGQVEWIDPAAYPEVDEDTGEEDYACPRQPIKEQPGPWSQALLIYSLFMKGHLPDEGAVSAQSNYTIEVFTLFDEVNRICDRELDRRERAKSGS